MSHLISKEGERLVNWFNIEPLLDSTPGLIGRGGVIRHRFFASHEVDVLYPSVGLLERHINRFCLSTFCNLRAPIRNYSKYAWRTRKGLLLRRYLKR